MNLSKLFDAQRELDAYVNKQHPIQEGEDRLSKKILALLVELSELANEYRGFKFWSSDQKPKPKLLEEYVDNIHFLLSLGLDYEIKASDLIRSLHENEDSIELQFIMINVLITELYLTPKENAKPYYRDLFALYIGLGEMLGFTWDEIEAAYFEKNKVNHDRQNQGY